MMKKGAIALCFVFGLNLFTFGAVPDFNGAWILDKAQSDAIPTPGAALFGGAVTSKPPADLNFFMAVQQDESSLRIATQWSNGSPTYVVYTLDGKESRIAGDRGGDFLCKSNWEGDKLVIGCGRKVVTPFGDIVTNTKEEWSLSADGKTLTVTTTTSGSQGAQTRKQVYLKK